MKNRTRLLVLIALLLAAGKSPGQKPATNSAVTNEKTTVSGHFELDRSVPASDQNTVSYTLAHSSSNTLHIELHYKHPRFFMMNISDSKGNRKSWMPVQKSDSYSADIDIAGLTKGEYDIGFYTDDSGAELFHTTIQ